jgi:hypothetical protein
MGKKRGENGRFLPGNEIGKETRYDGKTVFGLVKYKEEYAKKLIAYFDDDTIKVHTFSRFADTIGVSESTLANWAEKHAQFGAAYARAKEKQKDEIIVGTITRDFDSNFAKFLLINNYGMTDKSTIEASQEAPFEVNINVRKGKKE